MHKRHNCHRGDQDFGTESGLSVDRHGQYRRTGRKDLPVRYYITDRFPEALDYRTYHLADELSCYDYKAARSWTKLVKRLLREMESQAFDTFDLYNQFTVLFQTSMQYEWHQRRSHRLAVTVFHEALHHSRFQHPYDASLKFSEASEGGCNSVNLWNHGLSSRAGRYWRRRRRYRRRSRRIRRWCNVLCSIVE